MPKKFNIKTRKVEAFVPIKGPPILNIVLGSNRDVSIHLHRCLISPGMEALAKLFAESWCKAGWPNPLVVDTVDKKTRLARMELDPKGEPLGLSGLSEALVREGFATWNNAKPN